MFFIKRKINKLTIKVAKYKALKEESERFTKGKTNAYFIDCYLKNVAILAAAQAELALLTNET